VLHYISVPASIQQRTWIKRLVRFQFLTAANMKMTVIYDVAPCSLVEVYRRFRSSCCLHHQGDGPEHFWNVGKFLPEYAAQHTRSNLKKVCFFIGLILLWKAQGCCDVSSWQCVLKGERLCRWFELLVMATATINSRERGYGVWDKSHHHSNVCSSTIITQW
jgi:hypothetical protein